MTNQNLQLNIGDLIGFVKMANGVDETDSVIFFPVVEITTRDGERAYRYQYPDGEVSRAAICESRLSSPLVKIERANPKMICLLERRDEFVKAMKRGKDNDFEVFPDWEKDCYVIVNKTNRTEYRVKLETRADGAYAECGCKDFTYRKHICKHIAEVLQFTLFSTGAAA